MTPERSPLVDRISKEARSSVLRFLRRGKYLLGHDPWTLPVLLRLTPTGISRQITEHTDLVVEGFPRSGNTFMVTALQQVTDHRLRIASHVHHPAQVKLAYLRKVPTVLVVREPLDTLVSYLSYAQHGRPAACIKEYCSYHRELLPYLDQAVLCDFRENVSNLSRSIARINERFAMDIPPFDGSPDNTERVFEQISRFHKFTHPKHRPDLVTPRPSSARQGTADRFRSELEQPRYAELMADARDLYEYYLEKIEEQCAAFERISMSQSSAHAGSNGDSGRVQVSTLRTDVTESQ